MGYCGIRNSEIVIMQIGECPWHRKELLFVHNFFPYFFLLRPFCFLFFCLDTKEAKDQGCAKGECLRHRKELRFVLCPALCGTHLRWFFSFAGSATVPRTRPQSVATTILHPRHGEVRSHPHVTQAKPDQGCHPVSGTLKTGIYTYSRLLSFFYLAANIISTSFTIQHPTL